MLNSFIKKLKDIKEYNVKQSNYINDFVYGMNFIDDSFKPHSKENILSLYKNIYQEEFNNKLIELDENDYLNNPYILNVHPNEFKDKRYNLSYKSFYPYQPLLIDDVKVDNYKEVINIGYFSSLSSYKFLSIEKNNNIWMEITPHEIETMKESINEAKGNVLIYGLGLGYYAYMISLKDDVKTITIVEKDPEIIKLFTINILHYFNHKEKIKIIAADALSYIPEPNINYCFIDLWHDSNDGLPLYLKLLKLEKENIKYSYWIEESLIQMARRYLLCILTGENVKGYIYRYFKNLILNINLETEEDVKRLFEKEYLKELIKTSRYEVNPI